MQFDNLGDDEDLQNKDDDEQDDDQEKMHSAENMDIISELQMKQQQIAIKKDGLLSTEQNSIED